MPVLFYICEYFNITPQEFFDESNSYPDQLSELMQDLKKLDAGALAHISGLVKELVKKK